jgi:hypothetical protein
MVGAIQSLVKSVVSAGMVAMLAACGAPVTSGGADLSSSASIVTWKDGQPAYAISCGLPGGCQTRSQALCASGAYKVLEMQSMPSAGTEFEYLGRPSAVVRCS